MENIIIKSVYKREALWNPQHILYRNVGVLKKLWQEVSKEVKLDEKNVKTKWKNMRAYFIKEYKKIQDQLNTTDGDISDIKSHWMFFQKLMFLKKTLPALDNTPIPDESILIPDLILEEQPIPAENIKTEVNVSYDEQGSPASPGSSSQSSQMSSRKRKIDIIFEEDLEDEEKRKMVESEVSNSDMLFFESLIPYMQEIPMTQKLRLRSKIQDLILSELEIAQNKNN